MIILSGKLRRHGRMSIQGRETLKVWIEHETPRQQGPGDLRIEELFLPVEEEARLPEQGAEVAVVVRPYPKGREVAFSAIGLAPQGV